VTQASADPLIDCAESAAASSATPKSRVRFSFRTAAGGESHQRRVEVGVRGGLLGAGCVARELVPIAGPGTIGDALLDLRLDDEGELGRAASDALAELAGAPVFRSGELSLSCEGPECRPPPS
jgi:hypothetical protein